jgi:hypothetical protein
MLCTKHINPRSWLTMLELAVAVTILVLLNQGSALAQPAGQRTFANSAAACAALVDAIDQQDRSALIAILGPTADAILTGGDDVEDHANQRQFIQKYREMHRLVRERNGTATLYVGAENWPLPILLKRRAKGWYFDPVASRAEILFRRIGQNELAAIEVSRQLAAAQSAQAGTEDLIDPRSAFAGNVEPNHGTAKPRPFHGYYFRVLKGEGSDGASRSGIVAYPAMYRLSGVMTFMVNDNGVVYQRDLGRQTTDRAKALTQYNPVKSWKQVP